ncbi:MAG: phosphate ABC transporter ATP-binding protein PstB [Planctomycetota bacterium]
MSDKETNGKIVIVDNLNTWYDNIQVLHNINLSFQANTITSIMGPSGCGKSTFVKAINRILELLPGVKITGKVIVDNQNIYEKNVDAVIIRRKIGMVFQKPTVFPYLSILENVTIGVKLNRIVGKKEIPEWAEECLKKAGLWEEVKDKLKKSAAELSGGQQQRLCIARALAMKPIVLLLDEPCSAVDPLTTLKIEETLLELAKNLSIILVTHNLQQAARISTYCAFMYMGKIIEYGKTSELFTNPKNKLTEDFVSGVIG